MPDSPIYQLELNKMYWLTGQAIWYLQQVEMGLSISITLKGEIQKRGSVPKDKADAILSKHHANTLGTSINTAKKKNIYDQLFFDRLSRFKEERDWLVHRSVRLNGEDLFVNESRDKLFRRIESFTKEAIALNGEILADLVKFSTRQGVQVGWLEAYAKELIAKGTQSNEELSK